MKKKILVLFVLLFIPIGVFAGNDLDLIITSIDNIKNVIVEEDVVVDKVVVNEDNIVMSLLENNKKKEEILEFYENSQGISFSSGYITMPINTIERDNSVINNNQYAFYLYSIIENRTNTSYDEDTYYNSKTLKKIVTLLSEDETNKIIGGETNELDYYDLDKVFGITLKVIDINEQNITFKVIYHRYFNNNYEVSEVIDGVSNSIGKNPNTGNMNLEMGMMFTIVLGLTMYTLYNPKVKGIKDER